jgi:prophage regulatory protein
MQLQRYLRRRDLTERYNLPRSTIYDLVAKGLFPKPIRLGVRAVGWSVAELEEWERSRAADRTAAGVAP